MKILWITNILMPEIAQFYNFPVSSSGGWMPSMLEEIKKSNNQFAVASLYKGSQLLTKELNNITFYLVPNNNKSNLKYNRSLEEIWRKIKEDFNPDIIHIHGSEYPHGLAYIKACGNKGVVVSLQGLISVCTRYYDGGILKNIKKSLTFRDFIKGGIKKGIKDFKSRSIFEIELLSNVNYIIGRTDWDQVHAWAINPRATYFYCGEILRKSFYNHQWNYNSCKKNTIFISQGFYPIKGLHQVLKALPLVKRVYPHTKVIIAGHNIIEKSKLRISSYGKYIKKIISELDLKENIEFVGYVDETNMLKYYLESNVFICPSSIENSPNSLGEAQILEMPYIAAFVGGIPEIVEYNQNVLYRFEEFEMLACKIIDIFSKKGNIKPFPYDKTRYNKEINVKLQLEIYNKIFNSIS